LACSIKLTSFHYWFTDLELPFEAQAIKAAALSIDAASQADITRGEIGKAIAKLLKSGGKITQDADSWCEAIAGLADVSQGWISKFFAGLGGWRVWRQIITSLLKSSYRTIDISPALKGRGFIRPQLES
jgi:hypothetical protein